MKTLTALTVLTLGWSAFASSNSLLGIYSEITKTYTYAIGSQTECENIGGQFLAGNETDAPACVYELENKVTISSNPAGNLSVSVSTIGSNDHTCSFDGVAKSDAKDVFEVKTSGRENDINACVLKMSLKGTTLSVVEKSGDCRDYCGARASLFIEKAEKKESAVKFDWDL